MTDISEMIGNTFVKIENHDNAELIFIADDGWQFKFYHDQDCCETVEITEIHGDLDDLIGSPITLAEETSGQNENDDGYSEWTFYKFATIKGYVTIRWLGESNGYYSTDVDLNVVYKGDGIPNGWEEYNPIEPSEDDDFYYLTKEGYIISNCYRWCYKEIIARKAKP